jgi:hypothetical protein
MRSENARAPVYLVIVAWLLAVAAALAIKLGDISTLNLPDTDDAQRLVQVRDWLGGQAWGDVDQKRMNPPAGANMHWSRLVDLPVAGIVVALRPIVGAATAEKAAVAMAPLLALLAAMAMACRIGMRLGGAGAATLCVFFLLVCAPLHAYFTPLRIDHHNWQIALLLAIVACLVDPHHRARSGAAAGILAVLTSAIGLEMLPSMAAAGAALVVGWILRAELGRMLAGYGAALGLGTLLLYPAVVPSMHWWTAYCDALSPVYLLAFTLAGAAVPMLVLAFSQAPRRTRAIASTFALAVVAVTPGLVYPQCAAGPLAALDPAFLPVLSQIGEARPLLSLLDDDAGRMIYFGLYPFVGIGAGIWLLHKADQSARFAVTLVLALLVASIALLFVQLRASATANALASVLCATAAAQQLPRVRAIESLLLRLLATAALFVGTTSTATTLIARVVSVAGSRAQQALPRPALAANCSAPATLMSLNDLPPAVIANVLDMGPALLVHTPHRVIAGPYHRNARSILDVLRLWQAGDAEARAILARYGATHVLGCTASAVLMDAADSAPQGLWARLRRGETPAWLEPVSLPAGSPLRLYRVKSQNSP